MTYAQRFLLALTVVAANAGAQTIQARRGGKAPPPIPDQAYSACADKSQGDSVTDGQMTGTCELAPDGRLALRPSGPPPDAPGTSR